MMNAIAELSQRDPMVVVASPDEARQAADRATILAARRGDRASKP